MGRQTSWRYHHQKKELHFLFSHRYFHYHQHHPDIIVYVVAEMIWGLDISYPETKQQPL